jgi:hypothetical protein
VPVGEPVTLDQKQTSELKKLIAPLEAFSNRISGVKNSVQGDPSYLYYMCYWFNDDGQGQSQLYSTNDDTGGEVYYIEGGACMPAAGY